MPRFGFLFEHFFIEAWNNDDIFEVNPKQIKIVQEAALRTSVRPL